MITADTVIEKLPSGSKKQAFHGIAEAAALLCAGDEEAIFSALLARERLGTTGIGGGVAIPHIKITGVDRMYGVLARLEQPIEFDAIDGKPVDIVFALLAPEASKTTQHLKALAQAARFLKDEKNCTAVRAAKNKSDIMQIFDGWCAKFAA